MLTVNSNNIVSVGLPLEGREFTRYFSGFALSSLDQEVLCYHKKQIATKRWKDIGSGMVVFLCREKNFPFDKYPLDFFNLCGEYGKLLVRSGEVFGFQATIPLTGSLLGAEEYLLTIVNDLWKLGYVVNHSLVETKEFPLVQWSITDPRILETLVMHFKEIEKTKHFPIDNKIVQVSRRDQIVNTLINWCEENDYKTDILDMYDITLLECDPS